MNRAYLLSLLGLSLLLSACPFSSSKKAHVPRTRAAFCEAWASAACNDKVVSVCQAADADACRITQAAFCRSIVPKAFSDERGDACLDAVKAAYADADLDASELVTVRSLGAPCDRLVVGPKDEGETCDQQADCAAAAGFDCVKKSDTDAGTCQMSESVGAGQTCEAAQQVCTTGFFCDGRNCIAALDSGEPCTLEAECGNKGFCGSTGKCEARFAVDAKCSDDAQCLDGICYDFKDERVCTDRIVLSRSEPICTDLR